MNGELKIRFREVIDASVEEFFDKIDEEGSRSELMSGEEVEEEVAEMVDEFGTWLKEK